MRRNSPSLSHTRADVLLMLRVMKAMSHVTNHSSSMLSPKRSDPHRQGGSDMAVLVALLLPVGLQ
jgi:hypothetical protein